MNSGRPVYAVNRFPWCASRYSKPSSASIVVSRSLLFFGGLSGTLPDFSSLKGPNNRTWSEATETVCDGRVLERGGEFQSTRAAAGVNTFWPCEANANVRDGWGFSEEVNYSVV